MKNKNGFTLVELLAVIVILGVLIAIAVPSTLKISKRIKQNLWTSKIKLVEAAVDLCLEDNPIGECSTINQLISSGYLKADDDEGNFKNPVTNEDVIDQSIYGVGVNYLSAAILASNTLQTETPNFTYGAPSSYLSSNVSGIFTADDDLGTSYYLRGEITNNYVSFAGYTWRVVRINGDGTVRLIANSSVGNSAFNSYTTYDRKYVGYTYDNKYDSSGFVTSGVDSTIKTYLDKWYQDNITANNLDSYVESEIFCNDTTTGSGSTTSTLYYGPYKRIVTDISPILTCNSTDKDYGGKYKLKVGLLSRDEAVMSGLGYTSGTYATTNTNYLYNTSYSWTMSPGYTYSSYVSGTVTYKGFTITANVTASNYAVKPVINLKANTLVASGDGTLSNPYKVG